MLGAAPAVGPFSLPVAGPCSSLDSSGSGSPGQVPRRTVPGSRCADGVCVRGLTDEVGLAGVDGVLQLVGGDAELVLGRPVDGDGVVGCRAQLVPDGRRVGSWWITGRRFFICSNSLTSTA